MELKGRYREIIIRNFSYEILVFFTKNRNFANFLSYRLPKVSFYKIFFYIVVGHKRLIVQKLVMTLIDALVASLRDTHKNTF